MPNSELKHYASEYYDPVKAHEYYEQHKKLKGRTSTSGLNEKGRQAAQYVKNQITEEKKKTIATANENAKEMISRSKDHRDAFVEAKREQFNQQVEAHKKKMSTEISGIQQKLAAMSPAELKVQGRYFKSKIAKLREANAEAKAKLSADYKSETTAAKEQHSNLSKSVNAEKKASNEQARNDAKTKYENEISKLQNDASMKAIKKGKKGKQQQKKRIKNWYL